MPGELNATITPLRRVITAGQITDASSDVWQFVQTGNPGTTSPDLTVDPTRRGPSPGLGLNVSTGVGVQTGVLHIVTVTGRVVVDGSRVGLPAWCQTCNGMGYTDTTYQDFWGDPQVLPLYAFGYVDWSRSVYPLPDISFGLTRYPPPSIPGPMPIPIPVLP
jgi:hypothetical protein